MIKRISLLTIVCFLFGTAFSGAQAVRDGFSRQTLADGSVYVGQFKDGVFEGQGTLNEAHGEQYTGEFKDGLFDGQGVLLYTDGSKYQGHFKEGQLSGTGVVTYDDGSVYKGAFKDGDVYVAPPVDKSSLPYLQRSL